MLLTSMAFLNKSALFHLISMLMPVETVYSTVASSFLFVLIVTLLCRETEIDRAREPKKERPRVLNGGCEERRPRWGPTSGHQRQIP